MELEQTGEFEKDVKRLDKQFRAQLKRAIEKIIARPDGGKPLKYSPNTFSEKISNHGLIYRYNGGKILFVCFKNRDDVYDYIRNLL